MRAEQAQDIVSTLEAREHDVRQTPDVFLTGTDQEGRKISLRIPGLSIAEPSGAIVGRNPFEGAFVLNREEVSRRHFRLFRADGVLMDRGPRIDEWHRSRRDGVEAGQPRGSAERLATRSRSLGACGSLAFAGRRARGDWTVIVCPIVTRRSVAATLAVSLAWVGPALGQMSRFRSLNEAESAAAHIMEAAGLRAVDFVVLVAEGSNNAAAAIPDRGLYADRRVIVYDPFFPPGDRASNRRVGADGRDGARSGPSPARTHCFQRGQQPPA